MTLHEITRRIGESPGRRTYKLELLSDFLANFVLSNTKIGTFRELPEGVVRAIVGTSGAKWQTEGESLEHLFDTCVEFVEFRRVWDRFDQNPDWEAKFGPVGGTWMQQSMDIRFSKYAGLDRDIGIEQAKRDHERRSDELRRSNEAYLVRFVRVS